MTSELPSSLMTDSGPLSDKTDILNCFNNHFVSSGSLFETLNPELSNADPASGNSPLFPTSANGGLPSPSDWQFIAVTASEVQTALKRLDTGKAAGPDHLDPFFLKLAADFIAEPLAHIFNLSFTSNKIPKVWKSAFILPLLKGGEPSNVNNYRPISKLCFLAKLFEGSSVIN